MVSPFLKGGMRVCDEPKATCSCEMQSRDLSPGRLAPEPGFLPLDCSVSLQGKSISFLSVLAPDCWTAACLLPCVSSDVLCTDVGFSLKEAGKKKKKRLERRVLSEWMMND